MKRIIVIAFAAFMAFSASAAEYTSVSSVSQEVFQKKSKKMKKQKEIKEVTFSVHLHCANCVKKVEENIAFEKGVKDLKVSLDNQTVYVKYDAAKTSEEVLKKAIESLGYPVAGVVAPGKEQSHDHGHDHHNHAH